VPIVFMEKEEPFVVAHGVCTTTFQFATFCFFSPFFSLKRGHVKCALTLDLHIFHQKIIPKLTSRPYHFTVQHNYLQNDSKKKAKTKKRGRTTGRSRVVIRER